MNNKANNKCLINHQQDESNPETFESKRARWEEFRREAGKSLKDKNSNQKTSESKLKHKLKLINFVTTRLCIFDEKKKKYVPMEEKQCVDMMCVLDYDLLCENIWKFYGEKKGFTNSTHILKIITGTNGPVASNTIQLEGKKDFFVEFVQKSLKSSKPKVASRNSNHATKNENSSFDSKDSTFMTKTKSNKLKSEYVIPKSKLPPITPSLILKAAATIDRVENVDIARAQKLIRTSSNWSWLPEFEIKYIKGEKIGSGSFRDAFKVELISNGCLPQNKYILKLWNRCAIEGREIEVGINQINLTKDLSQRAVQCQLIAQGLCDKLEEIIKNDTTYGLKLRYESSYLVNLGEQYGTMEPFLEGEFVKYLNNSMEELLLSNEYGKKSASLAHFSYEYTNKSILLTDLQGVKNILTDPEIASLTRYDQITKYLNYGIGNFGEAAIKSFRESHCCNNYCQQLNLENLNSPN